MARTVNTPKDDSILSKTADTHNKGPDAQVKVFGFPKDVKLPSSSLFCQKIETYLRIAGVPYELEGSYPFSAPKGKLPYIKHKGKTIADSHFIIRYLVESGHSIDLGKGLSPSDTADSRAWQSYIEELVYSCIVYERWLVHENYAKMAQKLSDQVSWALGSVLPYYFRRRIRTALRAQGVGLHSYEEIKRLILEFADNLNARLHDQGRYFHNTDAPSKTDVIIHSLLMNVLVEDANPTFRNYILDHPNLVVYAKRMTVQYFPEYSDMLKLLDSSMTAT